MGKKSIHGFTGKEEKYILTFQSFDQMLSSRHTGEQASKARKQTTANLLHLAYATLAFEGVSNELSPQQNLSPIPCNKPGSHITSCHCNI